MRKVLLAFLISILACSMQAVSYAHSTPDSKSSHSAHPEKAALIDEFWKSSDEAFHAGHYERAIALHKAIVVLDPHDVESYSNAAWLMWSLGNGDQAQEHIARGLKANPTNWEMWDAAGQQHDLQKYFSKAEFAYSQAVKFIPADVDSQMLRRRWAHAAEHAGNTRTAIGIWQKLVNDYPNDAVNQNNLNRLLHPKPTPPAKSNFKEAALWPVKVLLAQLELLIS